MLGWGSSYGPIGEACRRARRKGIKVAQAHLRNLNPLPANLGEVLRRYPNVVLPEMNLGQLALLLRGKYLVDVQSVTKVEGMAFLADEVEGHHRRCARRNVGRQGNRQGQVRPAGGGHRRALKQLVWELIA